MIKINTEKLKLIQANDVLRRRDELLTASDWVVLRSQETGEPVPVSWAEYRQGLRDITEQADFPLNIIWPEQPQQDNYS